MGKPSKAVRELREKYGLTGPVRTEVSCTHARSNAHKAIKDKATSMLFLSNDDLRLAEVALLFAAHDTNRDDLRPKYLELASRIASFNPANKVS